MLDLVTASCTESHVTVQQGIELLYIDMNEVLLLFTLERKISNHITPYCSQNRQLPDK